MPLCVKPREAPVSRSSVGHGGMSLPIVSCLAVRVWLMARAALRSAPLPYLILPRYHDKFELHQSELVSSVASGGLHQSCYTDDNSIIDVKQTRNLRVLWSLHEATKPPGISTGTAGPATDEAVSPQSAEKACLLPVGTLSQGLQIRMGRRWST